MKSVRIAPGIKARAEVERLEGVEGFERYQAYLRSVITTARRGALSRVMYLAERRVPLLSMGSYQRSGPNAYKRQSYTRISNALMCG